jgi:hypothetical protein
MIIFVGFWALIALTILTLNSPKTIDRALMKGCGWLKDRGL